MYNIMLARKWKYFEDCPNRNATGGPSLRRVTFVDDKNRNHVNLFEIQDEI